MSRSRNISSQGRFSQNTPRRNTTTHGMAIRNAAKSPAAHARRRAVTARKNPVNLCLTYNMP